MTLQENRKPSGNGYNTLYLVGVPLYRLITSYREIKDLLKDKRQSDEMFIHLDTFTTESRYFYAKLTPDFKEWLNVGMLTGCGCINFIQQRNAPDTFLIVCEENTILGSAWLDYRTKEEILKFFGTMGVICETQKHKTTEI